MLVHRRLKYVSYSVHVQRTQVVQFYSCDHVSAGQLRIPLDFSHLLANAM
jgi:hypothetical protein